MERIFDNKVALVTGGSFGIGQASAIAFARRGAKVVIADWKDGEQTIEQIRNFGGSAFFYKCDVSKEADIKNLVDYTASTFGQLDYAFNNAGIEGERATTHECTTENWDRTLAINLKGVWLCMKYEIAGMLKNGYGVIINNASIAGMVGFPGIPAYVASKHGVIGLSRNAALEYAHQGIRVNAICPGVIRTPMIERFTGGSAEAEKQFEQLEPVGRLGTPEEIAETVVWLCQDASAFITGCALPVDGGWTAQ